MMRKATLTLDADETRSGISEWWFKVVAPGGTFSLVVGFIEREGGGYVSAPSCISAAIHLSKACPGFEHSSNGMHCLICGVKNRCFMEELLNEGILFWQTHGDPAAGPAQTPAFWAAMETVLTELLIDVRERREKG